MSIQKYTQSQKINEPLDTFFKLLSTCAFLFEIIDLLTKHLNNQLAQKIKRT